MEKINNENETGDVAGLNDIKLDSVAELQDEKIKIRSWLSVRYFISNLKENKVTNFLQRMETILLSLFLY